MPSLKNQNKITPLSKIIDNYYNHLDEYQQDLEIMLRELIHKRELKDFDEHDYYQEDTFRIDKIDSLCDKINDIIETISVDLHEWFGKIKLKRPEKIWKPQDVKTWRNEIIDSICSIERDIDQRLPGTKAKLKRFKTLFSDGKRQLSYLVDLMELPDEFSLTRFRKIVSWALGGIGFIIGVFFEKIVDYLLTKFNF